MTKVLLVLIAVMLLCITVILSNATQELWDIKEILRDIRTEMLFGKDEMD